MENGKCVPIGIRNIGWTSAFALLWFFLLVQLIAKRKPKTWIMFRFLVRLVAYCYIIISIEFKWNLSEYMDFQISILLFHSKSLIKLYLKPECLASNFRHLDFSLSLSLYFVADFVQIRTINVKCIWEQNSTNFHLLCLYSQMQSKSNRSNNIEIALKIGKSQKGIVEQKLNSKTFRKFPFLIHTLFVFPAWKELLSLFYETKTGSMHCKAQMLVIQSFSANGFLGNSLRVVCASVVCRIHANDCCKRIL